MRKGPVLALLLFLGHALAITYNLTFDYSISRLPAIYDDSFNAGSYTNFSRDIFAINANGIFPVKESAAGNITVLEGRDYQEPNFNARPGMHTFRVTTHFNINPRLTLLLETGLSLGSHRSQSYQIYEIRYADQSNDIITHYMDASRSDRNETLAWFIGAGYEHVFSRLKLMHISPFIKGMAGTGLFLKWQNQSSLLINIFTLASPASSMEEELSLSSTASPIDASASEEISREVSLSTVSFPYLRVESGLEYWLSKKTRGRLFYSFDLMYLKSKGGTIKIKKNTAVYQLTDDPPYIDYQDRERQVLPQASAWLPNHHFGFSITYSF